MKRKIFTTVLVLGLVLALLAASAVAVEQNRAARIGAIETARQAMMTQYGFTMDTVGVFEVGASQQSGAWAVTFHSYRFNSEAIGDYVVTVPDKGEPTAAWSHDSVDPSAWSSGNLDAPVWGPQQLAAVLTLDRTHRQQTDAIDWADAGSWTLEQWAAIDAALAQASEQGVQVGQINVVPGPDDLQPEDAVAKAIEAARKKYGLSEEAMARYEPAVRFKQLDGGGNIQRRYEIDLEPPHDETRPDRVNDFHITLLSPSGEIENCYWMVPPAERTLPEGSLAEYKDAVRAFVEEGALLTRSPAEKADIAQRITDAGMADLLEGRLYIAPGGADLPEADALAKADEAMTQKHGFVPETLAMFEPSLSLQTVDGEHAWAVDYRPAVKDDWGWYFLEKLGEYRITLAADTGDVLSADWTLEAVRGDAVYTQQTWGQAAAYDAKMLPWVLQMQAARAPIMSRYDQYATDWMSIEDAAAHDQLFRDAGFSVAQYPHGLPAADEIQQEQALDIARKAVIEKYQVSESRFATGGIHAEFYVDDPEQPAWWFTFFLFDEGREDIFPVKIDARTGAVLELIYDSGESANG